MPDELLDTEQAAVRLNIPVRTLTTWRVKGRFEGPPYVRLGSNVRYRASDLDTWVASRVVGIRAS